MNREDSPYRLERVLDEDGHIEAYQIRPRLSTPPLPRIYRTRRRHHSSGALFSWIALAVIVIIIGARIGIKVVYGI